MDKRAKFLKDIGNMDEKILIQSYSPVKGAAGGTKAIAWTTEETCWAKPIDKPGKLQIVMSGRPINTDQKLFISRYKKEYVNQERHNLAVVFPATGTYRKRYYIKTISPVDNGKDFMVIECSTHNAENVIAD